MPREYLAFFDGQRSVRLGMAETTLAGSARMTHPQTPARFVFPTTSVGSPPHGSHMQCDFRTCSRSWPCRLAANAAAPSLPAADA